MSGDQYEQHPYQGQQYYGQQDPQYPQQYGDQYADQYAGQQSGQYASIAEPAPYGYDAPGPAGEHGYAQEYYAAPVPQQAAYQEYQEYQQYEQQPYNNQHYGQQYEAYQQPYGDAQYGQQPYVEPAPFAEQQPYGYYAEPPAFEQQPYPDVYQEPYREQPAAPLAQTPHFEPYAFEQPQMPAQGFDPLFDQAYVPEPQRHAHVPAQYTPEPEPDPEPSAWDEAPYLEPVDDFDDNLPDDGPSRAYQPASAAPAPRPLGGSGRAAARRSTRKTRRPLVAAGGVVVTGAALAGVIVVQMPDSGASAQAGGSDTAHPHDQPTRVTDQPASRDNDRGQVGVPNAATSSGSGPTTLPMPTPSAPLTTTERMKVRFDLDAKLSLSAKFDIVPGKVAAPGSGKTYTYRVETEQGLGLDGDLFAAAVQQTLNDPRSWAHDGKTFARTDASNADFVIRLASPGTTNKLCGAAGLDTSIQNVSCDAAGTPFVVINAWRWAQGSPTFGDEMVGYRQMLISHEVGHRLGHNHEYSCRPDGLAPVMMQQTKTVTASNGQECKPNPWPYPA
ncbi:DUF3152 domain-containing protein [Yinghuangia seranimata]|uniref:DUF3152 domain-containing protein n=1 Tax=Yinghuangia seranimata TaxID=408067 RepID=UPI0031B9AF16